MDLQIVLRKLTVEDIEFFYVWAGDQEVAKTMTWEAYTNIKDAEVFLRKVVSQHPWFMAICFEGKPIGSITLTPGSGPSACRAELGYVLSKQYWGRGIATGAVKQALKQGFKDLRVQRIEAYVDPDNLASQKVLSKAGMHLECLLKNHTIFKGQIRDSYLYAITQ
jgi:ribosomal-protein-alanine N-acetyltransferase